MYVPALSPTLTAAEVEEIGSLAHGFAEHAGRTEANLVDVLLALDSLVRLRLG